MNVPGKLAVCIVWVAQMTHFPVSLNHSYHTTVAAYLTLAVHTVERIAGQESVIHCVVVKEKSIWTLYLIQ